MENLLFCPVCENFVDYEIREESETYPVKEEPIQIRAQVSYCRHCGKQIWNEELDEKNLKAAFDIFRQKHGLLTSGQIKSIREKYNISQNLFAKVLGLGAKTITRYENGSIQDCAHNGLIVLVDKPDAFLLLLETNKQLLTSEEYHRVKDAIEHYRVNVIRKTATIEACYSPEKTNYNFTQLKRMNYWGGLSHAG